LTRLEVRDPGKKIPESYIRLEHIQKLAEKKGACEIRPRNHAGHVFMVYLKEQPLEFLTLSEHDMGCWIEGVSSLIQHLKQLFYLKYNLKFLLGDGVLESLRITGKKP
jgi:hypothetical protein